MVSILMHAHAAQCLGRLVRDTPKGIHMLEFEGGGGLFHVPIRCSTVARNGDLCETCEAKLKKTEKKITEITGTTIQGMLPSYLMGRVTEPIPFWSRLYDGAWYRLKIESGCTLSEETMAKAKKAAEVAYEGVQTVEPQTMPAGTKKARGKGKKLENVVAAPAPIVAAPAPAPVVVPAPVTVKKRQPKKVAAVSGPPIALIAEPTQELPVETVREIKVRKREVDGRSVYVDSTKDKVYDLKFKYLGRLKEDAIISFPDSDEGI